MAISPDFRLPRDIGLLLVPGFSMLAFSSLVEPLRLTNQLLGQRYYRWRVFSHDGGPVRASCGMEVPADDRPDPTSAIPCVIVVAGFDPWPQADKHLKGWIRSLDRHGAILGAVDTGSFLLAASGVMGDVPVSLHWESAAAFSELFPDIRLSQDIFVAMNRRILCVGGTAILELMLDILERTHGAGLSSAISERLLYSRARPPAQAQRPALKERLALSDPDILNAIAAMERSVEQPFSIAALCVELSISKRTIERKFRRHLGRTPKQLYLELRLDHARNLLRHSDMTVGEIALACGFSSVSYFCRSYKHRFILNASKDRRLDYTLVKSETAQRPMS